MIEPLFEITYDALTGITEVRKMTEEEYAELLASGWTEAAPIVEEVSADEE